MSTQAADKEEVDVVVVGTGVSGLTAAVRAADLGLSVQVVEKTGLIGGTTALSGGDLWVPCNFDQRQAGVADRLEDAYRYVKTCARGLSTDDRVLAYVESADQAVQYLHSIGIRYRCVPLYSDYYPHIDGSRPGGRTMDPLAFDARKLGLDGLAQLRPTSQVMFGRMSMNSFDAHTILSKGRGSMLTLLWIVLRYWLDLPWRFKSRTDRRMMGGYALAGGLFAAARQRRIPIAVNTRMRELVVEDGRVTGIVVEKGGQRQTIKARKAVVLAAGGFERNQEMRDKYLPKPTNAKWTATPEEDANAGDAILAGEAIGSALHMMEHTWGAPTMQIPGMERGLPCFVERSLPGCMVVNQQGRRFLDESGPYPEFQQAMFADNDANGGAIPAYIVFDANFRKKYPMGPLMPSVAMPDKKVPSGYWDKVVWKGATLDELAAKIGVDATGLKDSAERMGKFARTGVDSDFGRGGNVFDRYYGDVNVKPNPNLAPIDTGPFYALQLWPGEIGTKGGLVTDRDARVLNTKGEVIDGLYCVGNSSASVMGPAYPGAGATLGPAATFAYRAAAHIAGKPIALEHPAWLEQTTAAASDAPASSSATA